MDLILNINKPQGWTSFQVVKTVRKTFKEKKAGHLGTLDPLATGVLPVFTGKYTKLISLFNGLDKTYRATLKFGETTDTFDVEGNIISRKSIAHLSENAIIRSLPKWKGTQTQLAPIYSAVKIRGVPSYRLARQGEEVVRKQRTISIHSLEIEQIALPLLTLRIVCSTGTYIRSLADDIGREFEAGAHLVALERLACGTSFRIEETISPDVLAEKQANGGLGSGIDPLKLLSHLSTVFMTDSERTRLAQGQTVTVSEEYVTLQSSFLETEILAKAVDLNNNQLLAIGQIVFHNYHYRFYPTKVFV